MVPPNFPPSSFEMTAQYPSNYGQDLSGSPSQFLRVMNPDSPAPATTGVSASSASGVCPSMVQEMMKVEDGKEEPTIELQKEIKNPFLSFSYSKAFDDVSQKRTITYKDKERLNTNHQDMPRKLDFIPQDSRQKYSEPGVEKKWQRKWCVKHFIYDLCAVGQEKPSEYIPSHLDNAVNLLDNERMSASDVNALTGPITSANTEAKGGPPEVIPGKKVADTDRFIDFVEHQRVSYSLDNQDRICLLEPGLRKPLQAEQRNKSEDLLEEAKKSETQWQSGIEQVIKELEVIEKNLRAVWKTLSCGRMQRQEMAPKKEAVRAVQHTGPPPRPNEKDKQFIHSQKNQPRA